MLLQCNTKSTLVNSSVSHMPTPGQDPHLRYLWQNSGLSPYCSLISSRLTSFGNNVSLFSKSVLLFSISRLNSGPGTVTPCYIPFQSSLLIMPHNSLIVCSFLQIHSFPGILIHTHYVRQNQFVYRLSVRATLLTKPQ